MGGDANPVTAGKKLVKKGTDVVTDVVDTGVSTVKKAVDVVADAPKAVVDLTKSAANIALDIPKAAESAITSTVKGTVNAAKDLATGTVDLVKDVAKVPVDLAKDVVKVTKDAVGDVVEAIIPTPKIPEMPVVDDGSKASADDAVSRSNQAIYERDRADRLRRRRGRAATQLVQPSIAAVPAGSVAVKSLLGQ